MGRQARGYHSSQRIEAHQLGALGVQLLPNDTPGMGSLNHPKVVALDS